MAQIPHQLPGDARNVHRRMDDAEFYLIDIPRGTLPQTPAGMVENTDEWQEWRLLNIELIHARHILNVQLAPPHNTPDNLRLAWDFWWRVATQHEHARNAHAFAYHGIRQADGENAEGIPELVQNIPLRIRALEQRAAARIVTTPPQGPSMHSGYLALAQPQPNDPYRPSNTPYIIQAQANATETHNMGAALSAVNAYNANPLQHQLIAPHPVPERYPLMIRTRSTDNRGSQLQRPPFSQPRHAVFLYLGRDLSGSVVLPRLSDGRNVFVRSATDQTDRGWGPGVAVHADVRAEVVVADAVQTSGLIGRDRGPLPLP